MIVAAFEAGVAHGRGCTSGEVAVRREGQGRGLFRSPTCCLTMAKKAADVPIFAAWPFQSDDLDMWQATSTGLVAPPGRSSATRRWIRQMAP